MLDRRAVVEGRVAPTGLQKHSLVKICNEFANRGVEDVILVCVDGLKGLPEAVESVWPQAIVQTRVVYLIRASTRYFSGHLDLT